MDNRPSWDQYFLNIVDAVSLRASCDRGKSGCVIVKNKRILATGYVGSPSGFKNCYEAGHLLREVIYENGEKKQHCMRTIHAEQNAIVNSARFGIALDGATLYCTMTPCYVCTMMIIASGIIQVIAKNKYHASDDSIALFKEAGVQLIVLDDTELY